LKKLRFFFVTLEMRDSEAKRDSARALTMQETMMLAAGMDLNSIRQRKKNHCFIRVPEHTANRTSEQKEMSNLDSDNKGEEPMIGMLTEAALKHQEELAAKEAEEDADSNPTTPGASSLADKPAKTAASAPAASSLPGKAAKNTAATTASAPPRGKEPAPPSGSSPPGSKSRPEVAHTPEIAHTPEVAHMPVKDTAGSREAHANPTNSMPSRVKREESAPALEQMERGNDSNPRPSHLRLLTREAMSRENLPHEMPSHSPSCSSSLFIKPKKAKSTSVEGSVFTTNTNNSSLPDKSGVSPEGDEEETPDYQNMHSPLARHWDKITNEKSIQETRMKFFHHVPKPEVEEPITWKTTVISKHRFVLPDYYIPRKLIGQGSYAYVVEALDTRTDTVVAIKRNRGFMHDHGDAKRILRELKLLMWFDHEDVATLIDVIPIPHQNIFSFQDLYLVLEKMDMDLGRVLKMQQLTESHRQVIIYQILRSLKYIHSANVIHRDLKPQNILIKALRSNTKVTDFGCSRPLGVVDPSDENLTEYVVTRWYRAPEIFLCSHKYDKLCDIWSLGCVFAEMYRRGRPLFPGPKSHKKQLELIFSTLGLPKDLTWIKNPRAHKFVATLPSNKPTPWEELCPGICDDGKDLLSKMLRIDPTKRISAAEALEHPFCAPFRGSLETEKECPPFDVSFEHDSRIRSRRGLRMIIYDTIRKYRERKRNLAASEGSSGVAQSPRKNGETSQSGDASTVAASAAVIGSPEPVE